MVAENLILVLVLVVIAIWIATVTAICPRCWKYVWIRLRGQDLDPPVAEYGMEIGVGVFQVFAGFIAAQQALLGVASQGRGREIKLPLIILSLAILAWWGIVSHLRLVKFENGRFVRPYSRATIAFGRWVLLSSVVVSVGSVFLAMIGLYPGQEPRRKNYESPTVPVAVRSFRDRVPKDASPQLSAFVRNQQQMDEWYSWILNGSQLSNETRLLWVEQVNEFDEDFNSFRVQIVFQSPRFKLTGRVAFLVSNSDGSRYRPVYSQQSFGLAGSKDSSGVVQLAEPNRGDRLVLWLRVSGYTKDDAIDACQVQILNPDSKEKVNGH